MNFAYSTEKLLESQPGILVAFDLDFRIFYVNRCVDGISEENVIGASAFDFIQPDDHEIARRAYREVTLKNATVHYEVRGIGPNGSIVNYSTQAAPIFDDGKLVGIGIYSIDVTEQKKREKRFELMNKDVLDLLLEIRPLEEILKRVIRFVEETKPELIGCVHLYNEYEQTLNYCASRGLSEFYKSFVKQVRVKPNLGTCCSAVCSGKREISADILEDDRWQDFRELVSQEGLRACWSVPIRGSEDKILGVFALYRKTTGMPDQDELELMDSVIKLSALAIERQLESERVENARMRSFGSSKLSALGEMAAGMAHELNNPLTVIVGKIDRMVTNLESGNVQAARLLEDLRVMEQTSLRIAKVVRAMRFLGRDSSGEELSPFLLQNIIEEVLQVTGEMFRSRDVDLRLNIKGIEQVAIFCRPSEIAQIIWNLLKNSYDSVLEVENRWVNLLAEKEGDLVRIRVQDAGTKIKPEIQEKMMRPFFTTKKVGDGIGLGLSVSKSIAENHGGNLYYEDYLADNSFVVELPVGKS